MAWLLSWNNIKHKLPIPYDYVFVAAEKKLGGEPQAMSIARYNGTGWELLWEGDNNSWACCDLTWDLDVEDIEWWMEIPNPPTGESIFEKELDFERLQVNWSEYWDKSHKDYIEQISKQGKLNGKELSNDGE